MKKANSIYKNAKQNLLTYSKELKRTTDKGDKAYIRMCLNDFTDSLCKQLGWHKMKEDISEAQYNLFCVWLQNLTCKLHP